MYVSNNHFVQLPRSPTEVIHVRKQDVSSYSRLLRHFHWFMGSFRKIRESEGRLLCFNKWVHVMFLQHVKLTRNDWMLKIVKHIGLKKSQA